jgi:hypothetical protein
MEVGHVGPRHHWSCRGRPDFACMVRPCVCVRAVLRAFACMRVLYEV